MQQSLFKHDFGAPIPRRLRIAKILEILRMTLVIDPPPGRNKIIHLCEDGTLDGVLTEFGYLITEESFNAWVRSIDGRNAAA